MKNMTKKHILYTQKPEFFASGQKKMDMLKILRLTE